MQEKSSVIFPITSPESSKASVNSGRHIQQQAHLYGFEILPIFCGCSPVEDLCNKIYL